MRINIVCVGKIKEKYLKLGIDEFKKRLSKSDNLYVLNTFVSYRFYDIIFSNFCNRIPHGNHQHEEYA